MVPEQGEFVFDQPQVPEPDARDILGLGREILAGLATEWEIAVRRLPAPMRERLRLPGFAFLTSRRTLGRWVGAPVREIRLSWTCVADHPWYAVVDVLRHEIAHQVAEDVFAAPGDGHGDTFQKACDLLGANPEASGTYPTLDEVTLNDDPRLSNGDRILMRIRKLLALADSPNENEARAAMRKAHELMARYNVDVLRDDRERRYVSIRLGDARLRQSLDRYVTAALLRDFYFVRSVWVPSAVLGRNRPGTILEISGTRENVKLAHYVHEYLGYFADVEWQRYLASGRACRRGKRGKRDFVIGVLQGFRETLEHQVRVSEVSRALVKMPDARLSRYLDGRYPSLRSIRRGRGTRHDKRALEHGADAGRRLVIRRPVEEGGSGNGGLLGDGGCER